MTQSRTTIEDQILLICRQFEWDIRHMPEPPGTPWRRWATWSAEQRHGPMLGGWWLSDGDPWAATHTHRAAKRLEQDGLIRAWRPRRGVVHVKLTAAGRQVAQRLQQEREASVDG